VSESWLCLRQTIVRGALKHTHPWPLRLAATALDSLEQKLRHYEQSIFQMKEYIESKMRETDYQGIKDECLRFTAQLNMLHRQMDEPGAKAYAGL
jgi:hypothetical protein